MTTKTKQQTVRELKDYLWYVYRQYTSHKHAYPRYNFLTNQQMELNHLVRMEILIHENTK